MVASIRLRRAWHSFYSSARTEKSLTQVIIWMNMIEIQCCLLYGYTRHSHNNPSPRFSAHSKVILRSKAIRIHHQGSGTPPLPFKGCFFTSPENSLSLSLSSLTARLEKWHLLGNQDMALQVFQKIPFLYHFFHPR